MNVCEIKEISHSDNNYAKEIKLIPRFSHLTVNEKGHIDVVTVPIEAKDFSSLKWAISNPDIAQIDRNGNIIALQVGKTSIHVYGKQVSSSVEVEVVPMLQRLYFSQRKVFIKTGNSSIIRCETDPPNAFSGNLRWEIDNKAIASCNPSKDGKKCQVMTSSSYEGKGNIHCYDPDTKLSAICNLEVYSSVPQNWRGRIALISMFVGIFTIYALPISTGISLWGLFKDHERARKIRYILCIVGSTLIFQCH